MGFLLLWVESLAVSLLFMAWVFACVGRWRRRWLRGLVWMVVALTLLLPYSLAALCTGAMKFGGCPDFPWFYYSLGLAISFFVGTFVLRVVSLRRLPETELSTVAAGWPRAKLLVVWCAVVALHVATIQNLDNAACRQIEAIRVENKKTLAAIVPQSAPESENALPLYEEAAEIFRCWTGNEQRWLEAKAASFDARDSELLAFMREKEPVARLLHAAAKRSVCIFPANPRDLARAQSSPFKNAIRDLALFLTLHCRFELAKGNREVAWRDVYALFQFAKHIRAGTWVNIHEGPNVEQRAIESLEYVLSAVQPTADELAAVKIDEFFSWRRAMRERFPIDDACSLDIITLAGVKNAEELRYYGLGMPPIANTPLYRVFVFPIDLAVYRHLAEETEIRLARPYYEAMAFPIQDEDVLRHPFRVGAVTTGASHVSMWYMEYPKQIAESDARHAGAVIALALARFRVKYDRLPKDLDALTPEFLTVVPIDPFDGKPMKYTTTDTGVVVYSAGRDMVEQGDGPQNPTKKSAKNGMTFELPRWNP
jgi:hypothetical protein